MEGFLEKMQDGNEYKEMVKRQFDFGPYPRTPIDQTPKDDINRLFIHSLVTPYYLRYQKVINTESTLILDAGCGSGYKSLALALANPGAHIIGVDLSCESVKLAEKRLAYHGVTNAEFLAMDIEDLPQLGLKFDYINCDDTLYLIPDPVLALQAFAKVLKPLGIVRGNFHSRLQRQAYYRAQEVFRRLGFMEDNPEDIEIGFVQDFMKSLRKGVALKQQTWSVDYEKPDAHERILANHLLVGDKGFTIPEVFEIFEATGLEFGSMVNWREWELRDLFSGVSVDELPAFLGMVWDDISIRDRLALFELIHPIHRLLDFWCGLPHQGSNHMDWCEMEDWSHLQVKVHPILNHEKVKRAFGVSLQESKPLDLRTLLSVTTLRPMVIDTKTIALLWKLMESSLTFSDIVRYWLALYPLDPLSGEPTTTIEAAAKVRGNLEGLLAGLFILLEDR